MSSLTGLADEAIADLPLDRLALLVLRHCEEHNESNTHNFLNSFVNDQGPREVVGFLSEAMNWLISQGLVCRDAPGQSSSPNSMFISRAGRRAA